MNDHDTIRRVQDCVWAVRRLKNSLYNLKSHDVHTCADVQQGSGKFWRANRAFWHVLRMHQTILEIDTHRGGRPQQADLSFSFIFYKDKIRIFQGICKNTKASLSSQGTQAFLDCQVMLLFRRNGTLATKGGQPKINRPTTIMPQLLLVFLG